MVKADIIASVAEQTGIMQKEVRVVFEASLNVLKESIQKGEDITLRGFGTFRIVSRKERHARDIRKNKLITIPAHSEVKFVVSPDLKSEVDKLDVK